MTRDWRERQRELAKLHEGVVSVWEMRFAPHAQGAPRFGCDCDLLTCEREECWTPLDRFRPFGRGLP
jgi:hypothetical protein